MTKTGNGLEQFSRWLTAAIMACAFIMAHSAVARAQNDPVLREQIKVLNAIVTLGDLFDNAGEATAAPVFRSPELGTSGVVAAKRIAAAAREHGLEWNNPGGIRKVVVTRPGRLITLDEVRDLIARQAGGDDEAWTVDFSRNTKAYHIDSRVQVPITIKRLDIQARTGKFRAVITVEDAEHAVQDKTFTGQAYPSVEAIVPARAIERGATIVADDLKRVRLPRSRVSESAIEDMETAIGMAARQRLSVGRPVRGSHLEHPKLVKRNGLVTIVYRVPGMVLKAKGKALADASRGQVVAIMNLQSKRTVEAQVTGTGIVSVSNRPGTARPKLSNRAARKAASNKGGRNSFVIR